MSEGKANNLKTGSSLGRYRILKKIGAGGMGEVFLAEDERLRRKVALKVLPSDFAREKLRLQRFEQEALTASGLNHPNVLTIYEFGADGEIHFLATEYVEGETLREKLNRGGELSLPEAVGIAEQIALALSAVHAAGMVHRDVKPENVMIRQADGIVKVLDFGLAKLTEAFDAEAETIVQVTSPGATVGTIAYMSPEQARGKIVDARTDLFSLGVVLYEMLARRQPFTGETASHTIVAILEKEPPPLLSSSIVTAHQITAELQKIILRALAKNAVDRYQTAAELVADLKALKKRLEFETEPQSLMFAGLATSNVSNNPTQTFIADSIDRGNAARNTIAVLPFVNMSQRGEDGDYFSDGLAEELLNVLSKISGLRVAARTSAFSFKGKQKTVSEIGKTLNVANVLEGSIRTAGNRVRIAVQLVDVADGYQLWSETYDRTMDDIFAVQDDIAESVVEELRARLLGADDLSAEMNEQIVNEVAAAAKGRAADPEAQRLMLLGRHFLDRTTREDTKKAIQYFQQALILDPNSALCWAELARSFSIEAGRGWIDVGRGFDESRKAAERALALEPNLAEGHAQMGRIQITHDWNFVAAEASFREALRLAPGSSPVLDGAGILAYKQGRFDEALDLSRRVLEQDPLSAAFWHNFGLTCHAANLLAESEAAFRRALELVPQRFVSNALLALVLAESGRPEEAAAQAEREPDEFWRLWSQTILFHSIGRIAESNLTLAEIIELHVAGNSFQLAEIYSMRGEIDEAFKWLERAHEERDSGITHTKVNPRFRPLRQNARWLPMLKRIGFET